MKTEIQNAATTLQSLWQDQLAQKRRAVASEAKKCVAILRNDNILTFGQMFEMFLTSLNSFNVHSAILTLVTLCYTWPAVAQAHATPTNSNAHESIQKLLRCASEAYTTNTYT